MAENVFGLTDTGRLRDNNEDTFIAQPVMNNRFMLACVIDGVGGYDGGEIAAAIARDEILKNMQNDPGEIIPAMIASFKKAGKSIRTKRQQSTEHEKMACVATLVMADIQNNQFYYAHVGDTRLYLLRDGSLVKISKDHSFVGFLEDSGRLTETAAMNHPKRNEINKALGFNDQIETDDSYIETGQSPFLPGDILLLCSDGLTDMVDKNDITEIITQTASLADKAALLVETANINGGRDNITVVLVQNDKKPQQQSATMPSAAKKDGAYDKDVPSVKQNVVHSASGSGKKSNGLPVLLGALCLLFMVTTIWLFLKQQKNDAVAVLPVDTTRSARNEQEILLQDAFDNAPGDTLVLSDTVFKSPVMISDTLHINQDSLYIKAEGNIVLQRDSLYNGPALVISPRSKFIGLDSLQFRDFNAGMYVFNTSLSLKNIRFFNCPIPVQNHYKFSDKKNVTVDLPVLISPVDSLVNKAGSNNGAR